MDWIISIVGTAALTGTLLSAAAWLGRTQISQWLTRDLELLRHRHAREMEAYRVSLIAETERTKAEQDVAKAGALRIIDKRYDALHELHITSLSLAGEAIYCASLEPSNQYRLPLFTAANKKVSDFVSASNRVGIFLSVEDRQGLVEYREALVCLMQRALETPAWVPSEKAAIQKRVTDAEVAVQELIQRKLNEMYDMGNGRPG